MTEMTLAERAEARSAITELLHRYAAMAREDADFAAMVPLFSEDAVFILPGDVEVPPTDIHKIAEGAPPAFIRHHVTTVDINFTSVDSARAETYFIAYTDLVQPDHWGVWRDELRKTPTGWRLTRKHPVVEGFTPGGYFERAIIAASAED